MKIRSDEIWNDTGISVEKGTTYHYKAIGTWVDFPYTCEANGYSKNYLKPFNKLKRVPSANWFQLIAVVDQDMSTASKLEAGGAYTAPRTGRLWAFANDAWYFYFNNKGSIDFIIGE